MNEDCQKIRPPAARASARRLAWVAGIGALTATAILFVDVPAVRWLAVGRDLPAWLESVLDAAGYYGQGFWAIFVFLFMVSVSPANRRHAAHLAVSMAVVFVLTHFLKSVTSRARPEVFLETQRMWWFFDGVRHSRYCSLPSAHTASAFAMSAVLARAFRSGAVVLFAAAFLCGVSRLVDVQHYVSDVIAGAALGVWVGYGVGRWRWSGKLAGRLTALLDGLFADGD